MQDSFFHQEYVLPVHLILQHVLQVVQELAYQDFTYQDHHVLPVQLDHCYVVVQALSKHVFQGITLLQQMELMDLM